MYLDTQEKDSILELGRRCRDHRSVQLRHNEMDFQCLRVAMEVMLQGSSTQAAHVTRI